MELRVPKVTGTAPGFMGFRRPKDQRRALQKPEAEMVRVGLVDGVYVIEDSGLQQILFFDHRPYCGSKEPPRGIVIDTRV